jgi:hypothetical protein
MSNTPDPKNPIIGDTYSTTIGRIVVYSVVATGGVSFYLNGEQRMSPNGHFHLMLRSIKDVTPIDRDITN